MRSFKFIAVTPVLFLATSLCAQPPAGPSEAPIPDGIGVNIHFTDPKPGELEQLYKEGFRWVRMDYHWGGIERKKGLYDFSAYDRLMAALDAHHIRAYLIFDYSCPLYDDNLSPHTDEGRAAFARWAGASVTHFKGRGIVWEMYNEPNIFFWRPHPNVDDYAKLAVAVGKAVHEAAPEETYIGPASSTIDLPFLESCFKAGCLDYWSAVSVHPYRQKDPETVTAEYRKLRQLIAQYAPKGRHIPIISGEWGYSSSWGHFDEALQGKYLPRELLANALNEIPISIWYDWHDDGTNPKDPEHHFGTVHHAPATQPGELYDPKPAYIAAKAMSDALPGATFSKRLWTGKDEQYVLLFDHPTRGPLLAYWTTGKESSLDEKNTSLPPLKFTDVVAYMPAPADKVDLLKVALAWSRAPLEVFVAGPGTAVVKTAVRNPLNRPIKVNYKDLKPGESDAFEVNEVISRDENSLPLDVTIVVDGLGVLTQRAPVAVTNPLRATIIPPIGAVQYVWIESPAGDGVRAKVTLTGGPMNLPPPQAQLAMSPGKTQALLKFDLPAGWPKDAPAGLVIAGPEQFGPATLVVAPQRFAAVAGFDGDHPAANWTLAADGDRKITSEQSLSDAAPPEGPPAPGAATLRLSYRMDKGWKFIRVAPGPKTDAAIPGQPTALGLWVYGNGKNTFPRVRFHDSAGQTFQSASGPITWTGWRYITFPLAGDVSHWGGRGDGVIVYPLKFDTLFLLDKPHDQAAEGEIFLSTPTLIYEK